MCPEVNETPELGLEQLRLYFLEKGVNLFVTEDESVVFVDGRV